MSSGWWRLRPIPRPTGLLAHRLAAAEASDPPATLLRIGTEEGHSPASLLRLPAWLHVGRPGRQSSSASPAARRDCRHAGFTIGTPVSQYGSVKLWKAKSVDRRALSLAGFGPWAPFPPPADPARGAAHPALPVTQRCP